MKKHLLATVFSALTTIAPLPLASAANLPLPAKSPPANPFQYPVTDGFYFGVGTEGGGGKANVTVPGINSASLVTNQIGVAGIVGYAWNVPNSSMFAAAEGWFGWQNINGATPGFSFSGPAAFTQRFLFGAPVDQIAALFPNILGALSAPPPFTLPAGQSVKTTKAYLGFELSEDDVSLNFMQANNRVWAVAPGITVGALSLLTAGTAIDAGGAIEFNDRGICVGSALAAATGCGKVGTTYKARIALKW